MTQPEDKSILREIVRIIEARRKVPEKVTIQAREYLITYLEDHQNRLEEALRRYDPDRLNMLFGQLASKIKYQFSRVVPGRAREPEKAEAKPAKPAKAPKAAAKKAAPVRKATTKKTPAKRPSAKAVGKTAKKKPAKATAKKTAAKRKPTAKKHK